MRRGLCVAVRLRTGELGRKKERERNPNYIDRQIDSTNELTGWLIDWTIG